MFDIQIIIRNAIRAIRFLFPGAHETTPLNVFCGLRHFVHKVKAKRKYVYSSTHTHTHPSNPGVNIDANFADDTHSTRTLAKTRTECY